MPPADGLRERKKQKTRDAIIAAALELFRAKGFDATTVDEIAAAVEISPRTFFRYFPTKEDVVFLDQTAENAAFARALAAARPGEPDLDRVERAMRSVTATAARNREWLRKMHALAVTTPALEARTMQLQVDAERAIVAALLGAGRHDRRRVARVRLLAACAIAALRASHVAWIEAGDKSPADRIVDDAMAVLRDGFARPERARGAR